MIGMTLSEVATVTGGTVYGTTGDPVVTSVEFDSRKAGPGALFLALPGERADGHDFAASATAPGAVATLAARPVDGPAVSSRPRPAPRAPTSGRPTRTATVRPCWRRSGGCPGTCWTPFPDWPSSA